MDCKTVQRLLADYTEGKLPLTVEEEVEKHLEDCEACQEEHAFYIDSTQQALLHSPVLPARYEHLTVSDRVMNRILEENKWAAPAPERAREIPQPMRRWITGLAVALLFACFLPIFMLGRQLNEVMNPTPADTATDIVVSAEALRFSPNDANNIRTTQYGIVASATNPISYSLPPEQPSRVHYGLLSALFGILISVVSMSWLSRLKKHAG
ncbi:anti-sigma factor family protein [Aneurinibacillus sp. UBA3580]|jgi:anti-sigma factor RsiW|uniref:anti-sigma factor family protein n=1 Tax=Aneurinibacillus sp. UBA3580 TaxID=1946041 RepID=UPI00257A3541|nr:zf-HC2 domain-containing protein [Aneurinibacillus sp. UBA3580]